MTFQEVAEKIMHNGWPDGKGNLLYGTSALTRYVHDMYRPIGGYDQAALTRGKNFVSKYL